MFDSSYRVEPGKKIDLRDWATDETGPFKNKEQAKPVVEKNIKKLDKLQELFYADGRHAMLLVLQAMDTGGKDGAISHVFSGVNPTGCYVANFKVPSHEELAHDYLWRYHRECPRRGMIGIFNRSHYESVLVERVKEIVDRDIWSRRFEQINDFERMLHSERTVVVKFFLHISKKEQKRRLERRLKDKSRHWKFDPNDLTERKRWDKYQEAFEDLLGKCSTKQAPWYIVPSDHKWFRNWVISDTIVRTLEKLDMKYPAAAPGIEKIQVK